MRRLVVLGISIFWLLVTLAWADDPDSICFLCHQGTGTATIEDEIFPIVFNLEAPDVSLAAGNFYWVTLGDAFGHNVWGVVSPDATLTMAPGGSQTQQVTCAGTYGCHGSRDPSRDFDGNGIVSNWEAITGAHHEDDSCLKPETLDVSLQGLTVGTSYRFLLGVKGIEDWDWEHDLSLTSHNTYYGLPDYLTTEATISSLCARCHPSFHDQGSLPGGDGVGIGNGSSPWLRHPTDVVIPDRGEYKNYRLYSLLAPVGKSDLYEVDPRVVNPGGDVVICLSCHRAHASPYAKILRWDYQNRPVDPERGGCNTCHTEKGALYLASAHASEAYGTKRLDGYARGNCAHCHEMHASLNGSEPTPQDGPHGYLLFAENYTDQGNDFCYYCHGPESLQQGGLNNPTYAARASGLSVGPTTIEEMFTDTLSHHNLGDILSLITEKWPERFRETSNPCTGCHNPHVAKRLGTEPLSNPVTRPLPAEKNNVWGDEETETMAAYVSQDDSLRYQAPLRPDGSYEPGSTSGDGSRMADYATFCTDCHNPETTIYSTTLGRELRAIDWEHEKHGRGMADGDLDTRAPYTEGLGYVVSCLDCHEPHGSANVFLIREAVNGEELPGNITAFETTDWTNLCGRCHSDDNEYIHHLSPDAPYVKRQCGFCHGRRQSGSGRSGSRWKQSATGTRHGGGPGHGGGGRGGPQPIPCSNCHFHGSDDSWAPDSRETGLLTF